MNANASAVCKICGARVLVIMAALHIEDHAQAGQLPKGGPR